MKGRDGKDTQIDEPGYKTVWTPGTPGTDAPSSPSKREKTNAKLVEEAALAVAEMLAVKGNLKHESTMQHNSPPPSHPELGAYQFIGYDYNYPRGDYSRESIIWSQSLTDEHHYQSSPSDYLDDSLTEADLWNITEATQEQQECIQLFDRFTSKNSGANKDGIVERTFIITPENASIIKSTANDIIENRKKRDFLNGLSDLLADQKDSLRKEGQTPLSLAFSTSSLFKKTPAHVAKLIKAMKAPQETPEQIKALFDKVEKIIDAATSKKTKFRSDTTNEFYNQIKTNLDAIRSENRNDSENTPLLRR